MHSKTLREYQQDAVLTLHGSEEDYLVEQPTGAGKTVEAVALTYLLVADGKRVLIAAPQEHIEENFTARRYDRVVYRQQELSVPATLTRAARDSKRSVTAEIRHYLELTESPGYSVVCTHSALTRLRPPTGIPADLSDSVLIVDEGHHAPALGLSQFVSAWKMAGGRVIYFTATGYRADGESVCLPGMKTIRYSLARHMAEGYAPRELSASVQAVRVAGVKVTPRQFRGEELPETSVQKALADRIIRTWESDGRPKTIIRVPPLRGGSSGFVASILSRLSQTGARVLDVSGSSKEQQKRVREALTDERERSYNQSQYDVIVGVQRVVEGFDWPLCAAVYCVGLPVAIHTAVQLMGRATRLKPRGYPAEYRNTCKLNFFVPCHGKETLQAVPKHHTRRLLLMCSFLHDSQQAADWQTISEIGKGLRTRAGQPPVDATVVEEHYPYIDPQLRADVELAIAQADTALREQHKAPKDFRILRWVYEHRTDIDRAVLKQILVERMVASGEAETRKRAASKLVKAVEEKLDFGLSLHAAMVAAFDQLLPDFRDETLTINQANSWFRKTVHRLTGRQIEDFATRLATVKPLTPDWLREACLKWQHEHGEWPFMWGEAEAEPGRTWADINRDIMQGNRQWPPLPHANNLHDFIGFYVRGTTVDLLLDKFLETEDCPAVSRLLVKHFADSRRAVLTGDGQIDAGGGRLGDWRLAPTRHQILEGGPGALPLRDWYESVKAAIQGANYAIPKMGLEAALISITSEIGNYVCLQGFDTQSHLERTEKASWTRRLGGTVVRMQPSADASVTYNYCTQTARLLASQSYLAFVVNSPLSCAWGNKQPTYPSQQSTGEPVVLKGISLMLRVYLPDQPVSLLIEAPFDWVRGEYSLFASSYNSKKEIEKCLENSNYMPWQDWQTTIDGLKQFWGCRHFPVMDISDRLDAQRIRTEAEVSI